MSKYAIARINITTWECQECKNPGIEKSRKDGEAEDSQVRATYEEVRDSEGVNRSEENEDDDVEVIEGVRSEENLSQPRKSR